MASPAYEQILAVQSLDLSLRRLRHRHEYHELRAEVREVEESIANADVRLAELAETVHGVERSQKRTQDEVATIEARRAEIQSKLYGGEVTASKELLALQDEEANLVERQRGIEDGELELMEEIESFGALRAEAEAERSGFEAARQQRQDDLDRELVDIETEAAAAVEERERLATEANAELLARYEGLRDEFDGVAVARLVNSACDGCHIQLSAVAVDRMAKMPEDAVVTCEECGRLIVR